MENLYGFEIECYRRRQLNHRNRQKDEEQSMPSYTSISHKMQKEGRKKKLLQKLRTNISELNKDFPGQSFNIIADTDSSIEKLEQIKRKAYKHHLIELQELAEIAIGKRIMNIEQNKNRLETLKKKQKKREIEENILQYKIQKTDFSELSKQKQKENTFIVVPYRDGRWFVPDHHYIGVQKQMFENSQYKNVIREVNKILFEKYYDLGPKLGQFDVLWRILLVLMILVMVLYLCVPFMHFSCQYLLTCVVSGILFIVLMAYVGKVFFSKFELAPVRKELQELLEHFSQHGQSWSCPEDKILYLQLKIDPKLHPDK